MSLLLLVFGRVALWGATATPSGAASPACPVAPRRKRGVPKLLNYFLLACDSARLQQSHIPTFSTCSRFPSPESCTRLKHTRQEPPSRLSTNQVHPRIRSYGVTPPCPAHLLRVQVFQSSLPFSIQIFPDHEQKIPRGCLCRRHTCEETSWSFQRRVSFLPSRSWRWVWRSSWSLCWRD